MARFHSLRIERLTRETPDAMTVALAVPPELRAAFAFQPGQYLTLRRYLPDGQEVRRSYSLCSSPLDQEWCVTIKKVPQGQFSTLAVDHFRVGETVDVMPPQGRFTLDLHQAHQKLYVAFAAGSGITPVFSLVKTILLTEPQSQVYLIYGNRGRNSIIFKEGIEALKNRFLDRLSVYHVLSREQGDADLFFGRIDQAKARLFLEKIIPPARIDEVLLCGPEEMIIDVRAALTDAGVAPEKIRYELFTTVAKTNGTAKIAVAHPAGVDDTRATVQVQLDGISRRLEMSYYGDTVLDAVLATGADAPYSCKNGMCSTCRARVTEGRCEMDANYSLDEAEVAAGYVLTCQARPVTPVVAVDYDA